MFLSEVKVLLLMRSGSSRRSDAGPDPVAQTRRRGLDVGGCGWPPLSCSRRNDDEEYYGADPRPRSLAFETNEDGSKARGGAGLDAASLPSLSESGMRSPQCRICFQGPEKVQLNGTNSRTPLAPTCQGPLENVPPLRSAALISRGVRNPWPSAEASLFQHVTRSTLSTAVKHNNMLLGKHVWKQQKSKDSSKNL